MPLCSVCLTKYDPTNTVEWVADRVLPPDLELYDFGGGMTVAPCPDLSTGDKYLTSHIAGLTEKRHAPDAKVLLFHLHGDWRVGGNILEIEADIKRAIEAFPTKAVAVTEGQIISEII